MLEAIGWMLIGVGFAMLCKIGIAMCIVIEEKLKDKTNE